MSDGEAVHQGRVELCLSGVWGTISYVGWSGKDATVVCRQLGYRYEGMINNCMHWILSFEWILTEGVDDRVSFYYDYYFDESDYTKFGPGSGPIWLSNVQCSGFEDKLLDCGYQNYTSYTHKHDVGVSCSPC